MLSSQNLLLLIAIVDISCIHATKSNLCLCTSRDDVQIYNDADMKSEIVTIPDRDTCFLGTMLTDMQGKPNGNYVALESLALGTCGDAILDSNFQEGSHGEQTLIAQVPSTKDVTAQFYGKWEDFFKRSYGGTRKRFLLAIEWTTWEQWGSCTRTLNGIYIQLRNRSCAFENRVDTTDSSCHEAERLDVRTCQFYGTWTKWESWSGCSLSQNQGIKIRHRICRIDTAVDHQCIGKDTEVIPCTDHTSLLPSEWSEWSECLPPCNGSSKRQRYCDNTERRNCSEVRHCTLDICAVDGNWASWNEWSACSNVEKVEFRVRNRTCTEPRNGGNACFGQVSEMGLCNQEPEWGNWEEWKNCIPSGGTYGVRFRLRACHVGKTNLNTCDGHDYESGRCLILPSPWLDWTEWSVCSVTCETGVLSRTRICNITDGFGPCKGNSKEEKQCHPSAYCPIDGAWSEWLEWSSRCSVTCGQGVNQRFRQCANPRPEHGGEYCKGVLGDRKPCILPECPRDGVWASWSGWSSCSVTCGRGTQVRGRRCDPPPMFGGANCTGDYQEQKTCVQIPCPINGEWSDWETWSKWDATCSFATRSRTRKCDRPVPQNNGLLCVGEITDSESTDIGHCPKLEWGSWQEWKSCIPVAGNNGVRFRLRSCHFGKTDVNTCDGNSYEQANCLILPSPWLDWTEWSVCSVTCETGVLSRTRICNITDGFGPCEGNSKEEKQCQPSLHCPIDGAWTEWWNWSSKCSVTCGQGIVKRLRQCANPRPEHGGEYCKGALSDQKPCILPECPLNGEWSDWESWSTWDATCSFATRSRTRKCDRPAPQNNGIFCVGEINDSESTDIGHCPIDGNWSTWLEWYGCDVTCGSGTNIRYRACLNPKPQHGGKTCTGDFSEIITCNPVECPVNGGWSQWGAWTTCSMTCASGTQTRSRTCTQPIPIFGGTNCQGNITDIQSCQLSPCPTSTLPPTTTKSSTTVSTTPTPTSTAATTTSVSTSTKVPSNFQCYACDGPLPQLCLTLMKPVTCPEPYCINEFTNDVNGEKLIDRRCGTKQECDQDWWRITSGNDKCMLYDDTQTSFHGIHCTFCCKDEFCNKLTVPASDSLYTPNI